MHTGDVSGGHYCAFIKPGQSEKWFKFDDDRVTPVTMKEVLEDNFGSSTKEKFKSYRNMTNAYMLVYIRQDQLKAVLDDHIEIPQHLMERLEQERRIQLQKQKEMEKNVHNH